MEKVKPLVGDWIKKLFSFWKFLLFSLKTLPPKEKIFLLILFSIFIASLAGLLLKINNVYSVETAESGGTINEGVIGVPRFINPLLAVSDTDRDLVRLIYGGLLESDGRGNLMPVLASKYEISEDGLTYTFELNQKARWQDGKPIKSDDVIFTVKLAKNPTLNSSKRVNWEGVEAEKIDDYTVRFWLKNPYSSFLENATLAIMPKHIWEKMTPEEISLSNFNLEPIGAGPYQVKKLYRNSAGIITSYKLKRNKNFALGEPFIKNLNIFFFSSEEKLTDAFRQRKIDSEGFISPLNIGDILNKDRVVKNLSLPRVFGVFFNSANNPIFEEKEARLALDIALDKQFVINEVLGGYGLAADSPIPEGSFGALPFEKDSLNKKEKIEKAKEILTKNGWKINKDGIFEKKSKKKTMKLKFSISTSNAADLVKTAEILKNIWEQLGARVDVKIFEIGDLNEVVIRKRNYEALLFGEVIGRDPDPFPFWHSSQRSDPGLNIAMYANQKVDKLLEDARKEVNLEKKIEKYKLFQKEVRNDQAAIFLYSPYFVYVIPDFLKGYDNQSIAAPAERFSMIHKWFIYSRKVWPVFIE